MTIEEAENLKTLKLVDLVGKLLTYEICLKKEKEEILNGWVALKL